MADGNKLNNIFSAAGTRKNQGKVGFYAASTAVRIVPRIFLGPNFGCAKTNYQH
jgi:hypothetical protein